MKRAAGILAILLGGVLLGMGKATGFAAISAGSVLLAWDSLAKRKRPFSLPSVVKALGLALLLIGIIIPAAVGCGHLWNQVIERLYAPTGGAAFAESFLAITAISLCLLVAVFWPMQMRDLWFLALASLIFMAAKIIYVSSMEMLPTSDFKRMWEVSSKVVEHGWPSEGTTIFYERSLPYLIPLRALFGPESSSYSIANVILGMGSSLLTYILTQRWFGRKAARIAFVLSACAIETWMASEIPTHDIPGAFFALLGITLYVFALGWWRVGRRKAAIISTAIFGVLALLLDLQRTTGPFLIVTCAFFGIASLLTDPADPPAKDRRRLTLRRLSWVAAVFLFLPLGVYNLLDTVLIAKGFAIGGEKESKHRNMALAAATDSWSDGGWGHFQQDYNAPYGHLPLRWGEFAAIKLASDTARFPLSRVSLYIRKAHMLFDLGSQTGFYVSGAHFAGGTRIDFPLEIRILQTGRTFGFVFLLLFVFGVVRLFGAGQPQVEWFIGIAYLALLSCVLLVFGEAQSRYLYPIWYLGAIYVGAAFKSDHPGY